MNETPTPTVEDDAQEAVPVTLANQKQAGRLFGEALAGMAVTQTDFGKKHDISKQSVGRLVHSHIVVKDLTRVKVLQALRELRGEEPAPDAPEDNDAQDVRSLLTRTHDLMATILAQDGDAFDYLWKLWRYKTGKPPIIFQYQTDIRGGSMNFPELSFVVEGAVTSGLIPADKAKRPWEVPEVTGDAERVWEAESLKLGRPEPIVRFMGALQLAGISTYQHQLPKMENQCKALGISVPDDVKLAMTQLDAITLAGYGYVPFEKVEPALRVVAAHIGRPGMVEELRGPWTKGAAEAQTRVTTGKTLEQRVTDGRWSTKEMCAVLGIAYDPHGSSGTDTWKLFESSRHTMPLRRLALLFANSTDEMRALDHARVRELADQQRLRGRRRRLNEVATARLLWGFGTDELGVDRELLTNMENDQPSGDLKAENVLRIIHEKGIALATADLRRYLERRALIDAGQMTRAICERHKLGAKGTGVAKIAKDLNIPDAYFTAALADGATMPMYVLQRMLAGMEGIAQVPARLEIDHRLARADHQASQNEGPQLRFLDAVMTEGHLSPREFNVHAVPAGKQRTTLNAVLKDMRGNAAKPADVRVQTTFVLDRAGVPAGDLRRGVGEVLADTNGNYPMAIGRLLHWMRGQGDMAANRRDLLALLQEIDGGQLAQPAALPPAGTELRELLERKQQTLDERSGATWDPRRREYERLRACARALRWLPGISRDELVAAATGLRRERLMAEVDSILNDPDVVLTPVLRAHVTDIVRLLIDDSHPEERVLRDLGFDAGTYSAWSSEPYIRPTPPLPPPHLPFSDRISDDRRNVNAPAGVVLPERLVRPAVGSKEVDVLTVEWRADDVREKVRRKLGNASAPGATDEPETDDDQDPPPDPDTDAADQTVVAEDSEDEEEGPPPEVLALLLPAVTEPLPPETSREYVPHPNDTSGIDFARMNHDLHLLGEYLRHYLAPRSAGYELHEPETVSLARAAVAPMTVNTHNVAMMLRMLVRSFGRMPQHHGTGLLHLRLTELLAGGESDRVQRALTHVLGNPADRLLAADLVDENPEGPLAALITTVMPLEHLRAHVPAAAPSDADIYEAPPETPKPGTPDPAKKKKKKKSVRGQELQDEDVAAAETEGRMTPQEWLAAHADLLAEHDIDDPDDADRKRRRRHRND